MAALVKDVVCGMMIDPATAAATSEYKSATYYFCAAACKQEFDANPEKFVGSGQPAAAAEAQPKPKKRWWEFWK